MFVVFDLETTGLSTLTDDIIQFAYALFDENNICVQAECLYYYYEGMTWSEEAYAVHHISMETLREHADEFETNVIKMYTVLNRACVCGHNAASFDCPFVKNWLQRRGLSRFEFAVIRDTMVAYRPVTHTARVSLINLCNKMGYSRETIQRCANMWFGNGDVVSHDASYDVAATALLTLRAVSEGYITWQNTEKLQLSFNPLELVQEFDAPKSIDPNGWLFIYNGTDGEKHYGFVNHDTAKYAGINFSDEMIESLKNKNRFIAAEFTQEDDNNFIVHRNGLQLSINKDNYGDKLVLKTSLVESTDTAVDLSPVIFRYFMS